MSADVRQMFRCEECGNEHMIEIDANHAGDSLASYPCGECREPTPHEPAGSTRWFN